jgi:hypothetical protein
VGGVGVWMRGAWRIGWVVALWCAAPAFASEVLPDPPAVVTAVSPAAREARVSTVGRMRPRLRSARIATITGFALIGSAVIFLPTGLGHGRYDFDGPWWRKAAYDRFYLVRQRGSAPMIAAGISLGSVGVPMVVTATLVEMEALKDLGLMRNTVGWLGLSALIGGAFMAFPGIAIAPTIGFMGIGLGGAGLLLIGVQYAMNEFASRRIPFSQRRQLYGPRPDPQAVTVTLAPLLVEGGAGLAVVGRF